MTSTPPADFAAELRSTQVVVVALVLGVAAFAAVALLVGPVASPLPEIVLGLDPIALTAILVSVTTVPLSFFLSARIVAAAQGLAPAQRVRAFRSARIVGAALCESAALLWCVALLVSGAFWFLAPIGVLAAVMGLHIPTAEAFGDATGQRV